MNKTIQVNIAGLAFALSTEAHARLSNYLDFLNQHYHSHEQKSEILEGIEERIAELFLTKRNSEFPINLEIVEEVIGILGDPETIEQEEPRNQFQTKTSNYRKRRLFRDPNHKVIGGVLAGIAHYLGIRPIFIRILFVIAFIILDDMAEIIPHIDSTLFSFITLMITYLGFCLYIPVAKTTEEQWEMMGEASDLNSIQNSANPHIYNKQTFNPKRPDSLLGRLIAAFVKLIGVFLIITGVCALTSVIVGFFFIQLTEGISWVDLLTLLNIKTPLTLLVLTFMVVVLPIIILLYLGTKLTFGFASPKWHPLLILVLLFIVSTTALSLLAVPSIKPYTHHQSLQVQDDSISKLDSDTIQITRLFPDGINALDYKPFKSDVEDCQAENTIYINKKDKSFVVFPFIDIDTDDDSISASHLEYRLKEFNNHVIFGTSQINIQIPSYTIQNNKIILRGKKINMMQPWDRKIETIELNLTPQKIIIWK